MTAPAGMTVVVCTHNRADMLRDMLASLAESAAAADTELAHLLVVDNACTDHTRRVVAEAAPRFRLRCVTEEKLGLSAARNRAVAENPVGDIWFLDDDVTVARPWYGAARRALDEHADADWMGGRILPRWPGRVPSWMPTGYDCPFKGMLVWYDQGTDAMVATPQMPAFFGANVGFRARVFDDGRRFDERLGPLGKRPRLGDDVGFQSALHAEGRVARYVPDAAVWHPVPPERLRLGYLLSWHAESGLASVRIARDADIPDRWFDVPRYIYRQVAANLVQGAAWAGAASLTLSPRRAAFGLSRLALAAGKATGMVDAIRQMRSARTATAPVDCEPRGPRPAWKED